MSASNTGFRPVKVVDIKAVVPNVQSSMSSSFIPAVVKTGQMTLPLEVMAMIPRLIDELNSGKSVIDYGEGATVKISQFADKMLDQVGMMNIGEFQKPLTDVLVLCTTVNGQSIQSGHLNSKIPFMNRMRLWFSSTKTRAMSNINSVRGQIDDITKELVKKEGDLLKSISTMEDMYMLNMQEYYSLAAHIEAAERVVKQKKTDLEMFIIEFNQSQEAKDPLVALEVQNRRDFVDSLDKKLYDLRVISLACLDTAPMIRNEQKSSTRMIEKFRNVRSMAIPLWKKQAALMLTSLENNRAAVLGKTIDDNTNLMVRANATQTAANTVATARLSERGILDVDTMEHVNQVLIDSINETMTIAEEGKQYRANATTRFEELKQSLNVNVVQRGMN